MSVLSLKTLSCNIYSVRNSIDEYGSLTRSYYLKYENLPCRICYDGLTEAIIAGKEQVVSKHVIFIYNSFSILESDIIVDSNGINYDILYVDTLYGKHIRIDAKKTNTMITYELESSSSSSESSSSSSD